MNLEATVKDLKAMTSQQTMETVVDSDLDVIDITLRSCKSIEDIIL